MSLNIEERIGSSSKTAIGYLILTRPSDIPLEPPFYGLNRGVVL
jgi:hypothetical protein